MKEKSAEHFEIAECRCDVCYKEDLDTAHIEGRELQRGIDVEIAISQGSWLMVGKPKRIEPLADKIAKAIENSEIGGKE